MTKKGRIAQYRDQLDKTLASHDLTNEEALKSLVKDQILRSSQEQHMKAEDINIDNVTSKRTSQLSNILGMLRSANEHPEEQSPQQHNSWKLKQDSEEFRVMYREGPLGSPFHTLLVEGYVDAPLDACLCISLEASLYPIWFPETRIPTFKIAHAECLQKIRIGEQVSLVRVKLSWPLSDREALMHFFEFEYLKEGLIIVIQCTFDVESIQKEVDGFSKDGIPEAGQTVRVDLIGGFALQKVSQKTTFFRTIANMDIKLDFVPPYLINFVSRQLIGGAFRLYKKTLTSVSRHKGNFAQAMNDPLYNRIRKALYTDSEEHNGTDNGNNNAEDSIDTSPEVETQEIGEIASTNTGTSATESSPESTPAAAAATTADHQKASTEIEEEVEEANISPQECKNGVTDIEETEIGTIRTYEGGASKDEELDAENHQFKSNNDKKKAAATAVISPRVEQALGTLDQAICAIREKRKKGGHDPASSIFRIPTPNGHGESSKLGSEENSNAQGNKACTNEKPSHPRSPPVSVVAERNGMVDSSPVHGLNTNNITESRPTAGSTTSSHINEATSNKIAPISPEPKFLSANESPQVGSQLESNGTAAGEPFIVITSVANGVAENGRCGTTMVEEKKPEQKKWRVCCLNLIPERLISSSS